MTGEELVTGAAAGFESMSEMARITQIPRRTLYTIRKGNVEPNKGTVLALAILADNPAIARRMAAKARRLVEDYELHGAARKAS